MVTCNDNVTTRGARKDRNYNDNKQSSLSPLPSRTKAKKRAHHVILLLHCLAALTWFILSVSFMSTTLVHQSSHHDKLSILQPTRDKHFDYDDRKLLLPPMDLKFDWNHNNRAHDNMRSGGLSTRRNIHDDDNDDDANSPMRKHRMVTIATVNTTIAGASFFNVSTTNNALANSTTLAILSVCIPGERFSSEYVRASLYNKQSYCNKWGIECILSNQRLAADVPPIITVNAKNAPHKTNMKNHDKISIKHSTKDQKLLVYSPKWEKLYLLNKTLHTHPNIDWLMWLDCDAAFTNLEIDWRTQLHPYLLDKSKVLIASKDKGGINLGVFFIPNTPPSKQLVKLLWEERHHVERYKFFLKDQVALQRVLKKRPQIQRYIYTDVPQRLINSYLDNKDGQKWQPKDWIVHQVFCNEKECSPKFISLLKEVTPWTDISLRNRIMNSIKSFFINAWLQ